MLGKLVNIDLRATARVLLPVLALLLLFSTVVLAGSKDAATDPTDLLPPFETDPPPANAAEELGQAVADGMVTVITGPAVALAASLQGLASLAPLLFLPPVLLIILLVMAHRFGKTLLGPQGHVIRALPVSVHAQIWAKLLSLYLWCAAALICALMPMIWEGEAAIALLLMLLGPLFLLPAVSIAGLMLFAAKAAGSAFARRRGLMSGLSFVLFFLLTLALILLFIAAMDVLSAALGEDSPLILVLTAVFFLFLALVFYLLTAMLLEKKANIG